MEEGKFELKKLSDENQLLKKQLIKLNNEHTNIYANLKEKINYRVQEIEALQKHIESSEKKHEDNLLQLKETYEKKLEDLKNQKEKTNRKLESKKDLEKKFSEVVQENVLLKESIAKKEDELKDFKIISQKKQHGALEEKEKEVVRLKEQVEELKKVEEKNVNRAALSLVGEKTKRILARNAILQEEIIDLQDKFKIICNDKKDLLAKMKDLKRRKSLAESNNKQLSLRNAEIGRECKSLKKTVKNLEAQLKEEMNKSNSMRKKYKTKCKGELQRKTKDNQQLTTLLKIRTTELVNLKRISEKILQQRSHLESFFMDSLAYVQNQKRELKLPNINDKLSKTKKQSTLSGKKKFTELEWTEKEKVINVLFARINGRRLVIEGEGNNKIENSGKNTPISVNTQ